LCEEEALENLSAAFNVPLVIRLRMLSLTVLKDAMWVK